MKTPQYFFGNAGEFFLNNSCYYSASVEGLVLPVLLLREIGISHSLNLTKRTKSQSLKPPISPKEGRLLLNAKKGEMD